MSSKLWVVNQATYAKRNTPVLHGEENVLRDLVTYSFHQRLIGKKQPAPPNFPSDRVLIDEKPGMAELMASTSFILSRLRSMQMTSGFHFALTKAAPECAAASTKLHPPPPIQMILQDLACDVEGRRPRLAAPAPSPFKKYLRSIATFLYRLIQRN
jgi:hypothetical protein